MKLKKDKVVSKEHINIRVTVDQKAKIAAVASNQGLTVTDLILTALENEINRGEQLDRKSA